MTTITERVREVIEASAMSVAEIAGLCGITPQSVYQWLDGTTKPSGDSIIDLAAATGFDALWIRDGAGAKRRLYATSEPQARVLTAMSQMSDYEAQLVVKITDSISQPQGKVA